MKKLVSLLVVLALTCVFLMSSAFAAGDPQIVVSSVEAAAGDEIVLTVSLVNNPGFTNGKISVTYDEAGLEFVELDTATQDCFDCGIAAMSNGPVMNFVAVQDVTEDIELFYIHLKVKDSAAGDYRVGLTIHLMKNNAEEDLAFTVVQGAVSVGGQSVTPPDTNPGDVPGTGPTEPGQEPTNPVVRPTVPGETLATKPGNAPTTAPGTEQSGQGDDTPRKGGGVYAAVAAVLVGGAAAVVLIARKKRKS